MNQFLDIEDPLVNAVKKLTNSALNVGTPVILLSGLIVCIICITIGLFLLKSSVKKAGASWGIAALAIIVSVAWTVIKSIAKSTGESAQSTDWDSLPMLALVPVLYLAIKAKKNIKA
ncbi:hypothetical protein [Staphylococcus succinus]|uniref:hypothetical protein n=1 Tax=Staphylococcus succinus TaxID=61015 RepID=UPI000E690B19|nr:hypothetical protein [Staphylococcus succinus]RIN27715.1 hypothetical protein BU067_01530 [Staphylococcus succinus]